MIDDGMKLIYAQFYTVSMSLSKTIRMRSIHVILGKNISWRFLSSLIE